MRENQFLALSSKSLHAGILEDGCRTHPETGNPQGGVISALLLNLFLHYVLDQWFASEVRPRLKGRSFLIRYEDFRQQCSGVTPRGRHIEAGCMLIPSGE